MKECTIYFVTNDLDKIRKIQKRFGCPSYLSVNYETPANIRDEDWALLKETERRGFIRIRNKIIRKQES